MKFQDRYDAGRQLAFKLVKYADMANAMVLALPRGGVPIGYEVATELHLPLDVFIVRKLGLPGHEELAMGAIATGGAKFLNERILTLAEVPPRTVELVIDREKHELERREEYYRQGRPPISVMGKTVLLVDDGLATGSSMMAAVRALQLQTPVRLVVAVPVTAQDTYEQFREVVDEVVAIYSPHNFTAVGIWYEDFSQTSDEEVLSLLQAAQEKRLAS